MEDGGARTEQEGNLKPDVEAFEDVKSKVIKAVVECLKLKDEREQALCGTTNLVKDLNLDSLDFVDLVMSLEETFGLEISDEEAQKLETVDDICRYILPHSA